MAYSLRTYRVWQVPDASISEQAVHGRAKHHLGRARIASGQRGGAMLARVAWGKVKPGKWDEYERIYREETHRDFGDYRANARH